MLARKRRWYCEETQLPEDWLPLRRVLLASSTLVHDSLGLTGRTDALDLATETPDITVHTGNAVAFAGQLVDKLLKLWKLYLELLYCGSKLISNTLGISTALELDW